MKIISNFFSKFSKPILCLGIFLVLGFIFFGGPSIHKAEAATCNATASGTWLSSSTGTATFNCSGTGGRPLSTDDVTINANVALTIDWSATVASLTMANPGATGANSIVIGGTTPGVTVTVTNGLSLATDSGSLAQTITIKGANTLLSVGSVTISAPSSTGSSTIVGTTATACSGTGGLAASGAITITGNTASTGTAQINMGACKVTAGTTIGVTGGTGGTGLATISTTSGNITSTGVTTVTGATTGAATITTATGVITAAGFSIVGGTVAGTVSTTGAGTITTTSGVTFTGTAAQAKLTSSSTGIFNNTGTISAGGTVTSTAGSTTHFKGTSTINGGYTWDNVTLDSGNTTTLGIAQTISGNFLNSTGSTSSWGGAFLTTLSGVGKTITNSTTFSALTLSATATITVAASTTVTVTNAFNTGAAITAITQMSLDNSGAVLSAGSVNLNRGSTATATVVGIAVGQGTLTSTDVILFADTASVAARALSMTVTTGTVNANGGINNTTAGGTTTLDMSGGAGTFNLKGAMQTNGSGSGTSWTFTMGSTSTFVYKDTSTQTVYMPASGGYNNLVLDNTAGATLNAAITSSFVTGNITVGDGSNTAAIFLDGGFAIAMTTSKTFTVNNSATFKMTASGTFPTGTTLTFTFGSTSTVDYFQTTTPLTLTTATYGNLNLEPAGTATQRFPSGTFGPINGNLILGDGTHTTTIDGTTNNPNITVAGTVTVAASATYNTGSGTLILSATGTPLTVTGTFASGGTVRYTGNGATIACTGASYGSLQLEPSGSTQQIICPTTSQTLSVSATLTIGDGTNQGATADTNDAIINTGNLTVADGATFTASSSALLSILNSFTVGGGTSGVFTESGANINDKGSTLTLGAGSTWNKNASSTLIVKPGSGSTLTLTDNTTSKQDLGAVEITSNVGNSTLALGSSAKFTTILIDASQVLNSNGTHTLTLTGSGTATSRPFINNDVASGFLASTGTVEYVGTSTTDISGAPDGLTYNNLTLDPAGTVTYNLGSSSSQALTVNGSFVVGDGTNAVTVTGVTHTPGVTVGGTLTVNNAATYISGFGNLSPPLTLSGTGTPLVINSGGTFTATTGGAITYTGSGATVTCNSVSYDRLSLKPAGSSDQTICTGTGQTLTAASFFTVGDGSHTGGASATTFNPIMNVGPMTIVSGTFTQGTNALTVTGSTTVNGTFSNTSTGAITLGGDVSNAGTITIESNNTTACSGTDNIVIASSAAVQRTWSGAGTFNIYNVSASYQAGSVTVFNSTDGGNNGWTFSASGCTPTDSYWVAGTGNWSDAATHWAITTGGSAGAGNLPGTTTNVHFDSNSGTGTVTINSASVTVAVFDESASGITVATSTNGITITDNATVNGTVSGATAMTLNGSSKSITGGSGGTISSPVILGATRTVAVPTGTFTMSGIISDGGGGFGLNKTGAGQLGLSGANTFGGGLTIKAGTVQGLTSTSSLGGSGTGTVTIGDTTGSTAATLDLALSGTFANPITVASGSSGTLSITNSAFGNSPTMSGAITLSNNLTIALGSGTGSVNFTFTGGVTGTGNLIYQDNSTGGSPNLNITTTSVNNIGTITNSGTSVNSTTISAVIGTSVTGVIQNSATSQLNLSGANTFTGGLTIKSGIVDGQTSSTPFGGSANVITIGDSSGTANAELFSDVSATFANPITVASGSSGTLSIVKGDSSFAATFSGAITLHNNVTIITGSISSHDLTFTGGVTGTGNLILQTPGVGLITFSGTSVNNTGTITNSGSGSAVTAISAVIGTNVTGVVENSATSQLTLSGVNTFTTGIKIKSGTVEGDTSTSSLGGSGTGTVTVGDTTGTAAATLALGSGITYANPITVASGSSGTLSISGLSGPTLSGAISLSNNVTIGAGSFNTFTVTGGITGTGNVNIFTEGDIHLNTGSLNNTGTITDTGVHFADVSIGSVIGTSVTGVIQNSNDDMILGGTNTFTGGLTIKAGDVEGTVANAFGGNTNVITLGDSTGTANATLFATGATSFANPITVASGNTGTAEIENNSISTNVVFSGAVTLHNNLTFNPSANNITMSGGFTGSGNLILSASGAGTLTFSTTSVNNTGTITNSGTGSGGTTISAAIGTNVTGITENSSTSSLTLSGTETPGGSVTVTSGTLSQTGALTVGTLLTVSSGGTFTQGAALQVNGGLTLSSGSTFTKNGSGLVLGGSGTITDSNSTKEDLGVVSLWSGANGMAITFATSLKMTSFDNGGGTGGGGFGTVTIGSHTLTLTGTGTGSSRPLHTSGSGTTTTTGSTIEFTGVGTTDIASTSGDAITYNNLLLDPAGTATYNFGSAASQTLTIGGTLTVGDGTHALTATSNTYNPAIGVTTVSIAAGATLAGGSSTTTVHGNFTNSGTFTANTGTVAFDTSAAVSTITGATTFNNFTSTTPGKVIKFQKATTGAPVFTVAGTMTITGTSGGGNTVTIESDTGASQWIAHFNSTQTSITFATIQDSGCDSGTSNVTLDGTSVNSGNNGACWVFPSGGITISGHAYNDGTGSPAVWTGCNGSTTNIALSINGGTKANLACNASTGVFSFTSQTVATNNIITLYMDTGGGDKGVLYTRAANSSTNITSLSLTKNIIWLRYETGTSISNADINTYDKTNDTDIPAASDGVNLTGDSGVELRIDPGMTYAPGGNVTVDNLHVRGTYSGNTETLTTTNDITIDSSAVFDSPSNVTLGGNLTNNGTYSSTNPTGSGTAPTSGSGITLAQQVQTSGTSSSSLVTPSISTQTGNMIIASVRINSSVSNSVSGISGGGVTSWTLAKAQADASGDWDSEIWYGYSTGGAGAVTTTLAHSATSYSVNVSEWEGLAASSPLDGTNGAFGTAASALTSGSITPTATKNDLIIVAGSAQNVTSGSDPSGFTPLVGGAVTSAQPSAYQIVNSATGSYSASWTVSSSTVAGAIVAFKSPYTGTGGGGGGGGGGSFTASSTANSAWGYTRPITIDHTKVGSSNSTNFPILVSGTYPDLRTTGNGGKVQNSSGYDVIFASDALGVTKLNWETENYSATTGTVNYWVQVPTLSHTADTTIYMLYGNSAISTDQSNKTGTWDSNFKAVYHMPDGTTLSANDSTSNANNGTLNNTPGAVAGQIGGGMSVNGSTQSMTRASNSGLAVDTGDFTVSTWFKSPGSSSYSVIFDKGGAGRDLSLFQNGHVLGYYEVGNNGVGGSLSGTATIDDGAWHLITWARTGSANVFYVDGVVDTSVTDGATTDNGYAWNFGTNPSGGGSVHSGSYDEIRISNTRRSADWITAEYNNQFSPSTFYSVGKQIKNTVYNYNYTRPFVIDHTKVPNTDQANFPVLISGTYAYLATVANSGKVQSSNGYDIAFSTDSAGTNLLPWEQERYVASTGEVDYWVQVPSVSHTVDTTIYVQYGNSLITTDQSTKNDVWDNNFKLVQHLPDGTTLSGNDSTINNINFTNITSTATATAGTIGGAANLNNARFGNNSNLSALNNIGNLTWETWFTLNSNNGGSYPAILDTQHAGGYGIFLTSTSNQLAFFLDGAFYIGINGPTLSLNTPYHVVATFNNTTGVGNLYVNGSLYGTQTNAGAIGITENYPGLVADSAQSSNINTYDEIRFSNVDRSADWVAAEYNNENSPATFYTPGSETANTGGGGGSGSGGALTSTLTIVPGGSSTSILGANGITFYNVTVAGSAGASKSLLFKNGNTYGFNGAFNIAGQTGQQLSVGSTSGGNQWLALFQGTASISYVTVSDSGCAANTDGILALSMTSLINAGDNGPCWIFITRGAGILGAAGGETSSIPSAPHTGGSHSGGGGGSDGGGTPSQATGVAVLSGTTVASVSMTSGGSGYGSTPPSVAFCGGGGSGAAGTAVLSSGSVASVTITNAGTNYTSTPSVLFGGTCGGGEGGGGGGDSGFLYGHSPSNNLATVDASGMSEADALAGLFNFLFWW